MSTEKMNPFKEIVKILISEEEDESPTYMSIQQLFDFVEKQLTSFQNKENRACLIPILKQSLNKARRTANTSTQEVGISVGVCRLLRKTKDSSADLKTILLVVYYILQHPDSGEHQNPLKLDESVGATLKDLLAVHAANDDHTLIADILTCIRLYVRAPGGDRIMRRLLEETFPVDTDERQASFPDDIRAQIVVQLFDEIQEIKRDFHRDPRLVDIIHCQLSSEQRDVRKTAYFLMKKVVAVVVQQAQQVSDWELDNSEPLRKRWIAYITIMENLDENQSHLILPSLGLLASIEDSSTAWEKWMNILYKRLLAHNNILVVRWILKHFLRRYCHVALSKEMLMQMQNAFNNTHLYNHEGYSLPIENVEDFLKCQQVHFIPAMVEIKWKSVPLHFWLNQLRLLQLQLAAEVDKEAGTARTALLFSVDRDDRLQLARRVRLLQNPLIRNKCIDCFVAIFHGDLSAMKISEYISLVKALHNPTDSFKANEWGIFLPKLKQYAENVRGDVNFTERFYDILSCDPGPSATVYSALYEALHILPNAKHGWLRFLAVFGPPKDTEGFSIFWRLNYNFIWNKTDYDEFDVFHKELHRKLLIADYESRAVVARCYDFYARHIFHDFPKNYQVILEQSTHQGAVSLSELLLLAKRQVVSLTLAKSFIDTLRRYLKLEFACRDIVTNLLTACKECERLSDANKRAIAGDCLELDLENLGICASVLSSRIPLSVAAYVRGLTMGDAKTGEARIEEAYEFEQFGETPKMVRIRFLYLCFLDPQQVNEIIKELLALHIRLSRKKARYYENSTEHRQKMRIAYAVLYLIRKYKKNISGDAHLPLMWEVLLLENNQLNIAYIYECAVAVSSRDSREIVARLQELNTYTSSQQVSVISVAHTFCILNAANLTTVERTTILEIFLPLTMGANFQTRLYSQLAILSITQTCQQESIEDWDLIIKAIETSIGGEAVRSKIMPDIRLQMGAYWQNKEEPLHDAIMYITNAPYDEYDRGFNTDLFEASKALFSKRICNYAKSLGAPDVMRTPNESRADTRENAKLTTAAHVQRKMNPTSDVIWQNDFTSYSMCNGNDLFVVASLIDKLPNLGGIARTCEVLGIRNLVLDTKACTEKTDFQNLSVTAEKALNIVEIKAKALSDFLMQKQTEGFSIIGAEQTASSVSFVDFQFPKKTILLLGHEKEGIPANLLAFLDYAVEIPQFGIVRSLNVHVTGALFMWEYCRQHIIDK